LVVLRVLSTESTQQQQATSAAEESLKLFQNRYAGGVDTYLQVVTSQTTAFDEREKRHRHSETTPRSERAS
jgi:outer membrane protein TolC